MPAGQPWSSSEIGHERSGSQPSKQPVGRATLRATTSLRLPDCCVLDTALTSAVPLATFDAALAQAARRLGVTVLP